MSLRTPQILKQLDSSFNSRCYKLLLQVPEGRVTTYRELAKALKSSGYRAVGQAMNRNPFAPTVPCHRVVRSDGSLGGYAGGLPKKVQLLKAEGVGCLDGKIKDLSSILFKSSEFKKT